MIHIIFRLSRYGRVYFWYFCDGQFLFLFFLQLKCLTRYHLNLFFIFIFYFILFYFYVLRIERIGWVGL